jgi:hypothetical protein
VLREYIPPPLVIAGALKPSVYATNGNDVRLVEVSDRLGVPSFYSTIVIGRR